MRDSKLYLTRRRGLRTSKELLEIEDCIGRLHKNIDFLRMMIGVRYMLLKARHVETVHSSFKQSF